MDEASLLRSESLFRLIFGRPPSPTEIDELSRQCESFESFRVRLITMPEHRDAFLKVLDFWRGNVSPPKSLDISLNALMHTLEGLNERQRNVEEDLKKHELEMLDLLRRVDMLASQHGSKSEEFKELRAITLSLVARLAELDRATAVAKA